MELLNRIKADQLAARKAKEKVKASILTLLLGDIDLQASKPKGKTPLELVGKFIKDLKFVIETSDSELAKEELSIITVYLPEQLTEDQIKGILSASGAANMGMAMKHMSMNFKGQYDGKMASSIAKGMY